VIYSIGYQGFRSAEDFVEVLKAHKVDLLVDVRSQPIARFSPAFSQVPLSSRLPLAGIAYQWRPNAWGASARSSTAARGLVQGDGLGQLVGGLV
jgi:uncharacterized protein (DUF488 family)